MEIGLKRFMTANNPDTPLTLKILPLRKDAPIFLEPGFTPDFGQKSELESIDSIKLVPEYELRIPLTAGAKP